MTTLGELWNAHDKTQLPMVCEVEHNGKWVTFKAYFDNRLLYGQDEDGRSTAWGAHRPARLTKKTKTYYPFILRDLEDDVLAVFYFENEEQAKDRTQEPIVNWAYIGPAHHLQPIEVDE